MKKTIVPYLVILSIAILASTLINSRDSLYNVSACLHSPGCVDQDNQPKGKLTIHNYGFPSTYKQTITFNPVNDNERANNYAGYAVASTVSQPTSAIHIAINVIFWFGLLYTIYSLLLKFRSSHHEK